MTTPTPSEPRSPLKMILFGCAIAFGIFAFACCLLSAGGAVAYRVTYPPLPAETEALLDIVDDDVAELRQLEFQRPVSFTLLTGEELRQNIEDDFAEEWSVEEARDSVITLAAFDLVEPDFDLYNLYLDLYSEQIAGYYDPEEKTLYVISDNDTVSVGQRLTLAHELTHALQDQHFDLNKLVEEEDEETNSEADFAYRALVEGEASLVEQQYLARLAPHEYPLLVQEALGINTEILDKTPFAIAESQIFPYREGLDFVTNLYENGGWPALSAAYDNPPLSTEQILHPDRYHSGDTPQIVTLPPLTDTLGSGWRWVDEDNVGEFFMRLHLGTYLTPTIVAKAATGWGGDWYAVYHNNDKNTSVLAMRTVWDTPADAAEFLDAYSLYLDTAAGTPADLDVDNQRCWQIDGEYRCLFWANDEVTLIRAPDEAVMEQVFDAIEEQ